ncbi:MAG TPA: CPBP family intramembrane glutamic endopeptidase [Prosthecobacter sp.]
MVDAAAIGVLRDLAIYVGAATALGVVAYRFIRHYRPQVSWNQEGQVLSRPYGLPDLIVLALLGSLFISTMVPPSGDAADKSITSAGLVVSMVITLVICSGLLLYLSRIRSLNPAQLFGLQHVHWRHILKVVLVFALISLVSVSLVAILSQQWLQDIWPDLKPQDMVETFQASGALDIKLLVIFTAVIIAPLSEEILFRGFVYGVLKRYTDAPFAMLASSLMFAIIHMHLGSLLPLCVLAVLFCIAYEITGCLLVPMFLHMIFNSTSLIVMLFADPSSAPSP